MSVLGIGIGLPFRRGQSGYPRAGLTGRYVQLTEGGNLINTLGGTSIPYVSGSGLDQIFDFSVLNDDRFDKGSYVGNAYGLPEYYNFPYVGIYYDATSEATRYHWKLTDFHYANFLKQSLIVDNIAFLKAKATTNTSNEISSVSELFIYSTALADNNLSKIKNYIGIQADFYGDENLLLYPSFESDAIWQKQSGWSISGGFALYDASNPSDVSIYQYVGLEDNTIYKVGIESFDYELSQFRIYIGNLNSGDYFSGIGIKERISKKTGDVLVYFRAKFNTPLKLDNAYCYKLYQNYYKAD